MSRIAPLRAILFGLFLASGFCGLLYQIVWLRMAFAAFGVITPVLSIVLSVFMLGLAIGSVAGGKGIAWLTARCGCSAIWFYACAEFVIGLGGLLVPAIFAWGQSRLLPAGEMDSAHYLLVSALILGMSILPWCIFMGCTFPFMMSFIKERDDANTTGFSYLYLANVIGAMLGTLASAGILIEWIGLRPTLLVATATNFTIAAVSVGLGLRFPHRSAGASQAVIGDTIVLAPVPRGSALNAVILFATGFISMAMEVVWTRAFTPVLRTTIYSFAALLTVYLFATWCGSWFYRSHVARRRAMTVGQLVAILAVASSLPVLFDDPRIHLPFLLKILVVLGSIVPFCTVLGYLTPKLIDEYSAGRPAEAGTAYAINVLGCILGPLFAGYVLLARFGVKQSLVALAVPILLFLVALARDVSPRRWAAPAWTAVAAALLALGAFKAISYEDASYYKIGMLRRDYTATVLAAGEGQHRELFVNGISMTYMTPITKVMAHLPLATLKHKPHNALAICLGMGTTLRSLSTWDIDATAVELAPGVRDVLSYFFADADQLLAKTNCRVVIDDGRRFLRRTSKKFDVITIDPPPPVEAAGSSLLYSEQFYRLIKTRLTEGGILQQWFPGGEKLTLQATARALANEFPYIRIYHSIEDWGFHFTCSMQPLDRPTTQEFIDRMPEAAKRDLVEWNKDKDLAAFVEQIFSREIPIESILNPDPAVIITDDRPYNEYFLVRRSWNKLTGRHESAH